MVTTHALWYHRGTDLCIVPTEAARQRALMFGLQSEQVEVVGLPVAERFLQPQGDVAGLRRRLGWPVDLPVILLVGGGEGMGPLEKTAQAIAGARLPAALVVIAGRNQNLRLRLQSQNWPIPVFVYGFVREMPEFMQRPIPGDQSRPGNHQRSLHRRPSFNPVQPPARPGRRQLLYGVSEGARMGTNLNKLSLPAIMDLASQKRKRAAAASQKLARPERRARLPASWLNAVGVAGREKTDLRPAYCQT